MAEIGPFYQRPAAGNLNATYIATDYLGAPAIFWDNGQNWVLVTTALQSIIKSMQRVSITIASGATTNTATIAAVDTTKAFLVYEGDSVDAVTNGQQWNGDLVLTNATTVTANRVGSPVGITLTIDATVVEFNRAIKSVQQVSLAMSVLGQTTATQTINPVNLAKSAIIHLGQETSEMGSYTFSTMLATLVLTDNHTVTATRIGAGGGSLVTLTTKGVVVEFT